MPRAWYVVVIVEMSAGNLVFFNLKSFELVELLFPAKHQPPSL